MIPSDDLSTHRYPAESDTRLAEDAMWNVQTGYLGDYQFPEFCISISPSTSTEGSRTLADA